MFGFILLKIKKNIYIHVRIYKNKEKKTERKSSKWGATCKRIALYLTNGLIPLPQPVSELNYG